VASTDDGHGGRGAPWEPGAAASGSPARPWERLLSDDDRRRVAAAGFGQRSGFGRTPALLVIDVQNYMVAAPLGSPHSYPSACGAAAERALRPLAMLIAEAHARAVPVIYTRNEYRRDGTDIGVYRRKRGMPATEGWCLAGSEGARIHEAVAPAVADIVLPKTRPSAFFGTPLFALLTERAVDTLIVTGGSTSNCVRATAVDAASRDFRTIVVAECVFDRFELSHLAALFDLDRQYADVVSLGDALEGLRGREPPSVPPHAAAAEPERVRPPGSG
jgi:nicotinamidase-related amidase